MAPVAPELPPAALPEELYVAEKDVAASVVFNFVEQKLVFESKPAHTIDLIASDDLPPKLDSEICAPFKIKVVAVKMFEKLSLLKCLEEL